MFKIWDKKEKINGVDAEVVIKSNNIKQEDEIFLVIDDNTLKVTEIQFKDVICLNYNISIDLTTEEVAQEYIKIKEEEKIQAQNDVNTLEELGDKISILEAENQALKEELSQIQVSLASLVSAISEK